MTPVRAIIIVVGLLVTASSQANEQRGMIEAYEAYAVYKMGQFKEALARFRKLAENGNRRGMLNLGHMYAQGQGVAADPTQALHWYRQAAEAGDPIGMYYTARSLGRGTAAEREQALRWYRAAAEAGLAEAQFELGKRLLRAGRQREAETWLGAAADQGMIEARTYQSQATSVIEGVDAELTEAIRAALQAIDRAARQRNAHGIVHYLSFGAAVRVRLPGTEIDQRMDREGLRRLWQASFDRLLDYTYERRSVELLAEGDGVRVQSEIIETLQTDAGVKRLLLQERAWFQATDAGVRVRRLDLRIDRLR